MFLEVWMFLYIMASNPPRGGSLVSSSNFFMDSCFLCCFIKFRSMGVCYLCTVEPL
jgi:hypothetical protein